MLGVEAELLADAEEGEWVVGRGRREPGLVVGGELTAEAHLAHGVGEHAEGETSLGGRHVET